MKSFSLRSLRVQGYKILKDFTLDEIQPLNVIVGPNGCGKSALWEVITLVPELARGPQSIFDIDSFLNHQVFGFHRSTRGFEGVLHPTSSQLHIELTIQSGNQSYTYTLILARLGMPAAEVDTILEKLSTPERVLLLYEGERHYDASERYPTKHYRAWVNDQEIEILWPHYHPLLLLNAPNDQLAQDPLFQELRGYFRSWRGFHPVFTYLLARGFQNIESWLITPGERFPGEWLDTPMGNLPQVLWHLKNHNEAEFEDIKEIFLAAIDVESSSLIVEKDSDNRIKIWLEGAYWPSRKYWLGDWPTGWKAFLSWLVALCTSPAGVIYLEEPENNLHPRLLAQLVEQIRLANKRGVQVFISTHSMELVNSIEAEELILMKDGQAYRVDLEKADKIKEAGILLGGAWVEGFLEHFSTPPARSLQ